MSFLLGHPRGQTAILHGGPGRRVSSAIQRVIDGTGNGEPGNPLLRSGN
jgi:hypothetical protein